MNNEQLKELSPVQIRVLGCLLEKQITTPDQYPLSRNALRNACNQKSNREPVVNYEEGEIGHALRELEALNLVSEEWSVRVPKYRHHIGKVLDLHGRMLAILCPLMLRGPQTLGELRNHSQRLFEFDDVEDVQLVLSRLMDRDPPLACRLKKQPGQKEPRFTLLLGEQATPTVSETAENNQRPISTNSADPVNADLNSRIEQLEQELEWVKERLAALE